MLTNIGKYSNYKLNIEFKRTISKHLRSDFISVQWHAWEWLFGHFKKGRWRKITCIYQENSGKYEVLIKSKRVIIFNTSVMIFCVEPRDTRTHVSYSRRCGQSSVTSWS